MHKGEPMYEDLAQISKARDIYRTLALLAILSPKPVAHENGKHSPRKDNHTTGEVVNVSAAGAEKGCMA
jgi:hypothetical protein